MFNPHIHQQQQQQQQQQFHQHLRQLQQLFQQQQPPPPPPPQPAPAHHVPHHHHQTPRAIPVPPQTAPTARMVNLCQATQTTIITPNPMLQGALLMQQMQGNMRGFAMGGQQFRQFFAAGTRSSLLGPVPMGVAIKSPMMGFPAARPFHPHVRYYNNNNNTATTTAPSSSSSSSSTSTSTTDITGRPSDRKRDGEQMAAESSNDQPEASTSTEANEKTETDNAAAGGEGSTLPSEETLGEPVVKKPRTEGPEDPKEQSVVETQTVPVAETVPLVEADGELLSSECNSQLEDCIILDEEGSAADSDVVELDLLMTKAVVHSCPPAVSPSSRLSEEVQQVNLPSAEMTQDKDICLTSPENQEEAEEGVTEGTSKFYCYLCSITCHNQQNFRSHMNSVSHQQRMMEIQHMSNACLVTLLPRVQESLQGTSKDGEKKSELKRWCSTCQTHFSSSIMDHRRTKEHKLVSRTAISSCTVCKKHFRTSQIFIEHLQSQEHRQKVEKLQENEGCEDSAKLTVMDTEGFLVEEEEGSEVEEEEEEEEEEKDNRPSNEGDQDDSDKRDGWTSLKEVTLKNMDHDEQYDPDTVYGSSFFVPVAGFICRLCKKFYHFESSSLHSHCKSLKHFENLKKYKILMSQKGEAVESCRESVQAQDSVCPVPESNRDWSDDTSLDSGLNSVQPIITLPQMTQQPEKQEEPNVSLADLSSTSPLSSTHCTDHGFCSVEDKTTSHDSVDQKEPADSKEEPTDSKEEPADSKDEPGPDPTADAEGNEEQQEGEMEPVVVQGKKNSTGKAKAAPKRRSGRAANRR
ncbi:cdkn1a interacting zinc finger protein 1a isoform X2 [Sphaeramia orbicularis]|uniref:Matrin-type domain-containing protein n=1 Tax=Sphaeramia orbicularis TaxID=375764 RepID=A0A672ZMA6_9TELE|nr:cip1-interacting zinc finger protein isoform X2 [Sphaeramia orbicularis]